MKAYKGFILQEVMIGIVVLSLILSFSINKLSLVNKHSKDEAPVVFMGCAINGFRDSSEDLKFRELVIGNKDNKKINDKIIYKLNNGETIKTDFFDKNIMVSANIKGNLRFNIGPHFKLELKSSLNQKEIKFMEDGAKESTLIMINFGSFALDVR